MRDEKVAIVNICIQETNYMYKQLMYNISNYTIRKYSEKLDVPHIPIMERKYTSKDDRFPLHIEKLQVGDFLEEFDRVLLLDSDILINPRAEDIFENYKGDCLFAYDEGHNNWIPEEVNNLEEIYNVKFPYNRSHKVHLNGGVVIYSQSSKKLFKSFNYNEFNPSFYPHGGEQSYFNSLIARNNIPFDYLNPLYNWCVYETEEKFRNRIFSSFIHYAGGGFYLNKQSREKQIIDDFIKLGHCNGGSYELF